VADIKSCDTIGFSSSLSWTYLPSLSFLLPNNCLRLFSSMLIYSYIFGSTILISLLLVKVLKSSNWDFLSKSSFTTFCFYSYFTLSLLTDFDSLIWFCSNIFVFAVSFTNFTLKLGNFSLVKISSWSYTALISYSITFFEELTLVAEA
jgi:hypothetical protein